MIRRPRRRLDFSFQKRSYGLQENREAKRLEYTNDVERKDGTVAEYGIIREKVRPSENG